MKNLVILGAFLLLSGGAYAGTDKDSSRNVQVGDSVFIGACPAKGFKYIQYYRKTRFPSPAATYNKETGEDFYEYFFLDGDFDVKVLPCEYASKKFKIISLKVMADRNTGAERRVMFLELGPNTVAWVEVDGAVPSLEIYLE